MLIMASRPKISDKTVEKIENFIKENPEKGISQVNKAIEYLVDKGIKYEDKNELKQEIKKEIKKELA